MKKLIYFLFLLILISCSKTNIQVNNEFMDEYRYPVDSLKNPKVFVYQQTDSLDKLSFFLGQMKVENGNKIYIYVKLNNDNSSKFRDSIVYYYRDKNLILKDRYTITKDPKTNIDKLVKYQILQYSDFSKKRVVKTENINPLNDSIININTATSTFEKKTTYKVFERNFECLKMNDHIQFEVKHKHIPFIGKRVEMNSESILAKGIGMVYYSINNTSLNQKYTYKLKEIIEYKTYLAKYIKD